MSNTNPSVDGYIRKLKPVLKAYVKEAAELETAGVKVDLNKAPRWTIRTNWWPDAMTTRHSSARSKR